MTDSRSYARVTITLPPEDLAAADRLAAAQDRSRSWIIAEALRRYVAEQEDPLGPYRRAQLRRDMAMSPEERVQAAEATARQAVRVGEPQHLATYEEFRQLREQRTASS